MRSVFPDRTESSTEPRRLDWPTAVGGTPGAPVRATVRVTADVFAHDHAFGELAFVRSGTAWHETAAGLARIGTGDLLVLRPGAWHAYREPENLVVTNLNFDPAWLRTFFRPFLDGRVVRLLLRRGEVAVLRAAVGPWLDDGPDGPAGEFGRLGLALQAVADGLPADAPGLRPEVERAVSLLEANPLREWTIADLGQEAGLSGERLARRFREDLGLPPLGWLRAMRLDRAAAFLRTTDRPIGEIGAAVGYPDANLFARRFRIHHGESPREFRARMAG